MKYLVLMTLPFLLTHAALASDECQDGNFSGLKSGTSYTQLKFYDRFTELFSSPSPAPAAFEDVFRVGSRLCPAVKATYFYHSNSEKQYVMYTTYDDACDGGNTIGLIVNLELYENGQFENSVVATIGDSFVQCK